MDELIARIASLIRRYTRFNQQAGAMQKLDFDGLQIDLENRSVTTENGTFELPPKDFLRAERERWKSTQPQQQSQWTRKR